ncbi:hypothetical protein CAPTEDRAFT_226934 [Capitella teleta]|uniref:Proline-rich transmembrane protein 1 n=1 Tax=Capitella teleta TaxID=283909 RepID=R7U1Y3_CAPTE|nr:hypothetical protein CAPTEDRAFT_226934 [Capitella teleta]|eukprot:ELT99862.1 hypothetical protein CAPTEDRAFT_226934 [Capitella teleta]
MAPLLQLWWRDCENQLSRREPEQYMPPAGQYPPGHQCSPPGPYPAGPVQQYPPEPYPPGPGQQYPAGPYPPGPGQQYPAGPYPEQPKYTPGAMMPPQGAQPMLPVVVQPVASGTTTVVYKQTEPKVNAMGSIILSCLVFWCCNCPFGIIAFILATFAQSKSDSGDRASALCLQKTSVLFSFLGIILTIILVIIIVSYS